MNVTLKSAGGELMVSGVKIDTKPVTVEETPEMLHYLSHGWLVRCGKPVKVDVVPVTETVVRRKRSK